MIFGVHPIQPTIFLAGVAVMQIYYVWKHEKRVMRALIEWCGIFIVYFFTLVMHSIYF